MSVTDIRAATAEMRRYMPNACGDWADRIDAALSQIVASFDPQPLSSAESGELAGYIHGKDYRDNRVEAVAFRQRRFDELMRRYKLTTASEIATLAPQGDVQ